MPKPSRRIDLDQRRKHATGLKLWEKAQGRQTGPKTPEGRQRSAQRARKHGLRSVEGKALAAWLSSVERLVKAVSG